MQKFPRRWIIANLVAVIILMMGLAYTNGEMGMQTFLTITLPMAWLMMSFFEILDDE